MRKVILVFLAVLFIMTSCILVSNDTNSNLFLTHTIENGSIFIEYPQLKDSFENSKTINNMIYESFANNSYVNEYIDGFNSYLKIEYEIPLINDQMISIIAYGNYNITTAAHPVSILFTVNIDVASTSILKYSDLYDVDLLRGAFEKYSEQQLDEYIYKYVFDDSIVEQEYMCYLEQIDDPMQSEYPCFSSAFSEEDCIISFYLPHALGDHAEVVIPLSELINN